MLWSCRSVSFLFCILVAYMYVYKLIWHTIDPKSFLFGTAHFSFCASGAVNYDYIFTNSINSLLTGSRYIPNGAHINNLAHASKHIWYMDIHMCYFSEIVKLPQTYFVSNMYYYNYMYMCTYMHVQAIIIIVCIVNMLFVFL